MLLVLRRIARPMFDEDRERNIEARRFRSRTITLQVIASLTLHLSSIFLSLAGTAGLQSSAGGIVIGWSQFFALMPMLYALGFLSLTVSLSIWSYTFWMAVLKPRVSKPARVSVKEHA